jgi:hypothetical protein
MSVDIETVVTELRGGPMGGECLCERSSGLSDTGSLCLLELILG